MGPHLIHQYITPRTLFFPSAHVRLGWCFLLVDGVVLLRGGGRWEGFAKTGLPAGRQESHVSRLDPLKEAYGRGWLSGFRIVVRPGHNPSSPASLFVQETVWAKKSPDGQAVEGKCKDCCKVVATAWPSLSWESVVLRSKSDMVFRAEVRQALKVKAGSSRKFTQDCSMWLLPEPSPWLSETRWLIPCIRKKTLFSVLCHWVPPQILRPRHVGMSFCLA